jgi:hypothetical protein
MIVYIGIFSVLLVIYTVILDLLQIDDIILKAVGAGTKSSDEILELILEDLPGGKFKKIIYFGLKLNLRLNRLCDTGYLYRYRVVGEKQDSFFGIKIPRYHYKRTNKRPPRKKYKKPQVVRFGQLLPIPR